MPPKKSSPQSTSQSLDVPFSHFINVTPDPLVDDQYISCTTTPTPLVNRINAMTDLPFAISNIPNDPKGRCAIAKVDIPAGTTIICEETPLWVVSVSNLSEFCHFCSAPCPSDTQSNSTVISDSSGFYTWCNTACQTAMKPFCTLEHTLLAAYPTIAEQCNIDIDLLRLATKYIILKYIDKKKHASLSTSKQPGISDVTYTPYLQSHGHILDGLRVVQPIIDDISSLQLHTQHENDPGIIITSKKTIQKLHPLLSSLANDSFLATLYDLSLESSLISSIDTHTFYFDCLQNDLLEITGRINANIHSLQTYVCDPTISHPLSTTNIIESSPMVSTLEAKTKLAQTSQYSRYLAPSQYGMGLFPISAMFNHSCEPNSLFINQAQTLCIRTTFPIQKGEEIFVNYTSLNTDIIQRRFELLNEKGFWCQCRRCLSQISEKQIILPLTVTTPSSNMILDKKPASISTSLYTIPNIKNDLNNSFNKSDLFNEKLIRLLADRFVSNSIRSTFIIQLEKAQLIPNSFFTSETFSFDLLNPDQLSKTNSSIKPYLVTIQSFLETSIKVLSAEILVTQLTLESTQLTQTMETSAREFRSAYDRASKLSKINTPESATDLTQITPLDTVTTGQFLSKINNLYPGGLEFPSFTPITSYPSLIGAFYPTLQQSLTWTSTQALKSSTSNADCTPTISTLSTFQQKQRSFYILLVNHIMDTLFQHTLEVVQSASPFVQKQKAVEKFASFRLSIYPIGLYHNQYQITLLLSNIITAACPNIGQFIGAKYFLSTALPAAILIYYSNIMNFPSQFLSFLEICQYVYTTLTKAEELIQRYSQGPAANTMSQKFVQPFKPTILQTKLHILKRMNAVVRISFGSQHIQNFYFANLK